MKTPKAVKAHLAARAREVRVLQRAREYATAVNAAADALEVRATTDDHDKRTGEIVAGVALSRERVADVQVASRRLESAAIAYAEALPKRRRRRRV